MKLGDGTSSGYEFSRLGQFAVQGPSVTESQFLPLDRDRGQVGLWGIRERFGCEHSTGGRSKILSNEIFQHTILLNHVYQLDATIF